MVLPGVIDAHVHQRTFNDTADTWESLTRGAALSGVTTVIPYIPQASGVGLGDTLDDRPPRTPVGRAPATT